MVQWTVYLYPKPLTSLASCVCVLPSLFLESRAASRCNQIRCSYYILDHAVSCITARFHKWSMQALITIYTLLLIFLHPPFYVLWCDEVHTLTNSRWRAVNVQYLKDWREMQIDNKPLVWIPITMMEGKVVVGIYFYLLMNKINNQNRRYGWYLCIERYTR